PLYQRRDRPPGVEMAVRPGALDAAARGHLGVRRSRQRLVSGGPDTLRRADRKESLPQLSRAPEAVRGILARAMPGMEPRAAIQDGVQDRGRVHVLPGASVNRLP